MGTNAETEPSGLLKSAFSGQVFQLDQFKGIEPGKWKVEWKAALNRQVVLMLGLAPKEGSPATVDLDAALAALGYVKAGPPSEASPTA